MDSRIGSLIIKPIMAHLATFPQEVVGRLDTYCQISHGGKFHKTRIANDMGKNPNWLDALEFPLKTKHFVLSIHEKDSGNEDFLIGSNRIQIENYMLAKVNYSNWYPIYKDEIETGQVQLHFEFYPEGEQGYGMQLELASGLNSTILNQTLPPNFQTSNRNSTNDISSLGTSNVLASIKYPAPQTTSLPSRVSLPVLSQQISQSIAPSTTYIPQPSSSIYQPSSHVISYQPQLNYTLPTYSHTHHQRIETSQTYRAPQPPLSIVRTGPTIVTSYGGKSTSYKPLIG